MAKVIFSVGVAHPLFNKVVEATIIKTNCGYSGKGILAITNEEVYYPSDPKGIFRYDEEGNFLGFLERKAYSEKWEGWVDKVISFE